MAQSLNYDHLGLAEQLDVGVRQLELDIFADPEGGHFLKYAEQSFAPVKTDMREMAAAGFKVMHVPGLDNNATCATFKSCLQQIRRWSASHPRHLPIFITIDAKDRPIPIPGAITPVPLTPLLLDALDREVRSALPKPMLITPDDVRGRFPTLRDAVLANAWPDIDQARGKVMFILDVRAGIAERYRQGRPSLAGRAMFSLYKANEPEAATIGVQDPTTRVSEIAELVRKGFIVRTRSDSGTFEARNADRSRLTAAMASGAQMISTDFYPGAPDPQGLNFRVTLPGDRMARCNPVRQTTACNLRE